MLFLIFKQFFFAIIIIFYDVYCSRYILTIQINNYRVKIFISRIIIDIITFYFNHLNNDNLFNQIIYLNDNFTK